MNSLFSRVKSGKLVTIAFVFAALAFLLVFYGLAINNTPESNAVSALDFKAGRIIDDEVFYNPDTMTVAEIQAHLDKYSANCDMWGTNKIGYGRYINGKAVDPNITRREYARLMRDAGRTDYHDAPYVCISKFYENPTTHKTNFDTNAQPEEGMISAAQIIYNAAHEYSINPQVLLVMLKKESYVWGDTWPLKNEYNTVMGYACPDNAPCDSAYFGFYNQVMKAAWQLKYYKDHIYSYGYYPFMTNNIYYSPNYSCGTKSVYLENIATTSLYIYTPYTPNDAALANYPGEAYCGSYGNRNFFMYFSEWFGSTYFTSWQSMDVPRYLQIKENALIYNLSNGKTQKIDQGRIDYFDSKAYTSKGMCLRLKKDSSDNLDACIYYDDLDEVEWKWDTMATPRYLKATEESTAINITNNTIIEMTPKVKYYDLKLTTPSGVFCLRSSEDENEYCVDYKTLEDVEWEEIPMKYPRYLDPKSEDTVFINPSTLSKTGAFAERLFFSKQIILPDNRQCLIAENSNGCVIYDETSESIVGLSTPRILETNTSTQKYDAFNTKNRDSYVVPKGTQRKFVKKTYVRDESLFFLCLQTEYDAGLNNSNCINETYLDEVLITIDDVTKRINKDGYKISYSTGETDYLYKIDPNMIRVFKKKAYVRREYGEAEECFLTEYDVQNKTGSCIPGSYLSLTF